MNNLLLIGPWLIFAAAVFIVWMVARLVARPGAETRTLTGIPCVKPHSPDPCRIAASPLPTRFHEPYKLHQEDNCLVLGIGTARRLFWKPVGVVLVGCGGIGVAMACRSLWANPDAFWSHGHIFCIVPISISIWFGLRLVLMPWFRFDRGAGTLSWREPWSRRALWRGIQERPLTDIAAIQAVSGGFQEYEDEGKVSHYQLNLVLHTGGERLNLSDTPDRDETRRIGQRLAAFLGVPLIDEMG